MERKQEARTWLFSGHAPYCGRECVRARAVPPHAAAFARKPRRKTLTCLEAAVAWEPFSDLRYSRLTWSWTCWTWDDLETLLVGSEKYQTDIRKSTLYVARHDATHTTLQSE